MTNTESLCQILGGLKNRSDNMTQLHGKIIPAWLQLKKEVETRNLGTFSLNREGMQGPMNQRSDYIEAKHTCKQLYHEHTAITGSENKPIPPAQHTRQRRGRQFEGLEEYDYRLEPRAGWRFYPSSRPTPSSSSSHWEQHDDWKSNKSWDSWRTSS